MAIPVVVVQFCRKKRRGPQQVQGWLNICTLRSPDSFFFKKIIKRLRAAADGERTGKRARMARCAARPRTRVPRLRPEQRRYQPCRRRARHTPVPPSRPCARVARPRLRHFSTDWQSATRTRRCTRRRHCGLSARRDARARTRGRRARAQPKSDCCSSLSRPTRCLAAGVPAHLPALNRMMVARGHRKERGGARRGGIGAMLSGSRRWLRTHPAGRQGVDPRAASDPGRRIARTCVAGKTSRARRCIRRPRAQRRSDTVRSETGAAAAASATGRPGQQTTRLPPPAEEEAMLLVRKNTAQGLPRSMACCRCPARDVGAGILPISAPMPRARRSIPRLTTRVRQHHLAHRAACHHAGWQRIMAHNRILILKRHQ